MTDDGFYTRSVHIPTLIEGENFDDHSSMISDDRSLTATTSASFNRKKSQKGNEKLESQLPGNEDEGWKEVRVTGKDNGNNQGPDDDFMGDENSSVASSGAQTWQTRTSTSSNRPLGMGRGKAFKLTK